MATIVSMLGTAVLLLVILYVGPYWAVLAAVAVCGLVNQLCRPAAATLLSELTTPERQVMMFALYRWALNLGTTAAPLLAYAVHLDQLRRAVLGRSGRRVTLRGDRRRLAAPAQAGDRTQGRGRGQGPGRLRVRGHAA